MKLTFLGGADEVGASCTLVEIGGKRLLIDSGIRISPKTNRGIQSDQLPDLQPISALGGFDFLLVTHAHTDHTGALPLVVGQYPHIPVLMTQPTEALTRVLQKDAQRIMTSQFEQEGELPLFDEIAVDRLMNAIQIVEFNQPVKLGESLQVTYHVSGHIVGAALLVIESEEGTLVMSGDVSKSAQRTVPSIRVPRIKADALVLESTYGGRLHANREAEERRLIDTLQRVVERGGKALIPAFAIGRAQEVIQIILAYRDKFEVPVYVDGMVRSVCDAYARFSHLLPEQMVRSAGYEHLFFRGKVKPVVSTAMRDEIARGATPCVIVASSGMLTGGASQYYARFLAPDERNAILLTGYQDEESPGKLLQRLMKEKDEGETPLLKLDKDVVQVRCEVGTYSLSAHADEDELVNIARAMQPQEIMLVHGDPGARHSLATALRQRQIITTTPRVGTTRELQFRRKSWGVGVKLASGGHTEDFDAAKAWESLKDRAGDTFSARELALVWYGDAKREDDVIYILNRMDNLYFAADWRSKRDFRVQSAEQVARAKRQRAIMLAHPDLVGKLILLRNTNNQPRLGVVRAADIDSFEADVSGAQGSHYTADALLWIIGHWAGGSSAKGTTKTRLNDLYKQAKASIDDVLPFATRQRLAESQQAIDPRELLPDPLPPGIDELTALTSIVLALADDNAILEDGKLRTQRVVEGGLLEQNAARDLALKFFPPEARMRKVGMEAHRKRMILTFDFPDSATQRYGNLVEALSRQSGWEVLIRPQTNQIALSAAVLELLPVGGRITKGPSLFVERQEVFVEVSGVDDTEAYTEAFYQLTHHKLIIGKGRMAQPVHEGAAAASSPGQRMEINAAYGLIRSELEAHGLYKTSLKQGQIILSFITPQVGQRHAEAIAQLAQRTGYAIELHPNPNQQQVLIVLQQIAARAGLVLRKSPSLHVDRGAVGLSFEGTLSDEQVALLSAQIEEQIGYRLELI